jgi:hypothetical protein
LRIAIDSANIATADVDDGWVGVFRMIGVCHRVGRRPFLSSGGEKLKQHEKLKFLPNVCTSFFHMGMMITWKFTSDDKNTASLCL